jgi:hypothetical protein
VPDLEDAVTKVKSDQAVAEEPRYWGNVLSAFEGGLQLDLRLRLAIEFVKGGAFKASGFSAEAVALNALDCATELLRLADSRGLTKPLPEDDELNAPTRAHIRRNIRAQAYQGAIGQRIALEEAPTVVPATNGPIGINRR